MNLLPRCVRAIANQAGFSFGTPWPSEGGKSVVLPILKTALRPRRYVLAEETTDVRAEDVGRIDRLRVRNDAARRILLRSGALFRGRETQSRGTTASVVLRPRSSVDVEVKCIHAAQAIVLGASLELAEAAAPGLVHEALLRRDQGLVWAAVGQIVGTTLPGTSTSPAQDPRPQASDDPIQALSEAAMTAEDTLVGRPSQEQECGAFIIDDDGVRAAEVFDSPDSWKVASRSFLGRYAGSLGTTPPWRPKAIVDPAATNEIVKAFLDTIAQAESRRASQDSWTTMDPLGEVTSLDGEVIHFAALRPGNERVGVPRTRPVAHLDSPLATTHIEGMEAPSGWSGAMAGTEGDGGAEVTAAEPASFVLAEDLEASPTVVPRRRRKILSTGWEPGTFQALEHYSRKEFRGDRSAAIRLLVRQGLRRRGYLGPQPPAEAPTFGVPAGEPEHAAARMEIGRSAIETRIVDLERIAETTEYAGWLRQRARTELEKMAAGIEDDQLRAAARDALERLASLPSRAEAPEPVETEPLRPPAPPSDVPKLLRQALAANARGAHAEALTLFDEALGVEPENVTALLGRAFALRRSGRTQEALAGFDLVLRLQPNNAAALLNRGRIYQERGDFEGALEAFEKLVAVAPNDWDVWMARGDVLAKMGRTEAARAAYAEALRRNPDDEELQGRMRMLGKGGPVPAPLGTLRVVLPRGMEEGQSYLLKEGKPERSYGLLRVLSAQKLPSLLITRESPARIRQEPGFESVRVLGLGHATGPDVVSPTALPALARAVERFIEENRGHGLIVVDGLAFLIANNGFRETVMFVEHVNEYIMQRRAILLLSVAPGALPERELALLERNLKLVS